MYEYLNGWFSLLRLVLELLPIDSGSISESLWHLFFLTFSRKPLSKSFFSVYFLVSVPWALHKISFQNYGFVCTIFLHLVCQSDLVSLSCKIRFTRVKCGQLYRSVDSIVYMNNEIVFNHLQPLRTAWKIQHLWGKCGGLLGLGSSSVQSMFVVG